MTQTNYVERLINKFALEPNAKIPEVTMYNGEQEGPWADKEEYAAMIASFAFVLQTRPDLDTYYNILSHRQVTPTQRDMEELREVLNYLAHTKEKGVTYNPKNLTVEIQSDASCHNGTRLQGNAGLIVSIGESLIKASSTQIPCPGDSSVEVEVAAINAAAKTAEYVRDVFEDLGMKILAPTVIFTDCAPAIRAITNEQFGSNRTRHYGVKLYRINWLIKEGIIKLEKTPTENFLADSLTKITRNKFNKFQDSILNAKIVAEYGGVLENSSSHQ